MSEKKQWLFKQGDAFERLACLKSESVDCIVTDYPYESLEKHRAIGTTTRLSHSSKSSNDWFGTVKNEQLPAMLKEFSRVLKKNGHLYMFADDETSNHIWSVNQMLNAPLASNGVVSLDGRRRPYRMKWWKRIVWDKGTIGMGYHYRYRYEFICFMEKGKLKLNDLGQGDVIPCPKVTGGYPAEKPVGVSEILIRNSTLPGDIVLDPFCGSGSVGEAALLNGRRFIGFDISDEAAKATQERLTSVVESLDRRAAAANAI
jgi:site-specific DNA-methyltransferase (adenine-specific)